MVPRLTNCFLLLIAAAASASFVRAGAAQLPQAQSAAGQTSAGYPVEGMVVNAVSGEPVRNALVWIAFASERSSLLTGPEGKFHFDNVPPGALRITVQKPGFFSEAQLIEGGRLSAALQVGPDMPPVILKLVPEGVIFGRITDASGESAEELPVKVFYGAIVDGTANWQQQFGVQTNSDGDYRIFELRPGVYYLSAGRFTSTFYPGVRDIDSATPIRVAPGQQIRADFQLQPAAFYQITGTITGLPPGTSANTEMISSNFGGPRTGFPLHENGSFTQAVSAGRYLLRATANTPNGALAASVPLDVTSDVAGVRLVLAPTATIPLNVDFEMTRHAAPELPNGRSAVALTLVPKDRLIGNRYSTNRVLRTLGSPPEPPMLALRNVEPGVYRAELNPFGPWYVAAARRGITDLLSQDLVVDAGGESEPIEITLRDDFASVRGTVSSDGQPAQGGVLLIPERSQERALTLFTDAAGHFQMDAVPPGEYTAFAFDRVTNLEYRNPEAMRPYANGAQVARLQPGGEASLNLQLQKRQEY